MDNRGRRGRSTGIRPPPTHPLTQASLPRLQVVDTTNFAAAEGIVQRELDAFAVVRHAHCIDMRAYCRHLNHVYIIVSLAKGEVLVDWLQEKKQCTEMEAAIIIHAIFQGVSYLHSNKIVHRDLKLDNMMFDRPGDITTLKILDYGFSKVLQGAGDVLTTVCGSPQYVAPEILALTMGSSAGLQVIPYTYAVDAWSIGVIMYMLIAGYAPFEDDDEVVMFQDIIRGEFSFPSNPWDSVSQEAKDLICALLTVNPARRMDVAQALESPFIKKYASLYGLPGQG